MAAEPSHCRRGFVEVGPDQIAPVFGVEFRGEARRADQIAEHDGDRPALRVGAGRRRGRRRVGRRIWGRGRRFAGGETGDRPDQLLSRPERNADFFEVGLGQVGQDVRVDLMLAEQGFILSEPDRVQPLGDVHRRSRARFDSHDGPRETESPGWGLWPAAIGSMRPVRHAAGECLLFPRSSRRSRHVADIAEGGGMSQGRFSGFSVGFSGFSVTVASISNCLSCHPDFSLWPGFPGVGLPQQKNRQFLSDLRNPCYAVAF
jgi:hypothetical protein